MSESLEKILYVEDEDDIRAIAELALGHLGSFKLLSCASGAEALAVAAGQSVDLVLLDVMMPGMDGPEVLRQLRVLPAYVSTPVIFMTAKVQPEEQLGYLSLGAAGVIAKPFDPLTLADQVRDIWSAVQSQN